MRRFVCGVVGCRETSQRWNPEVEAMAYGVGALAARLGFAVLTGGHSGVMESALEGAKSASGLTIGILRTEDSLTANAYVDVVIPTGMGDLRNGLTAMASDVMVALPGGLGTLQEASFAADWGRPVIGWRFDWALPGMGVARTFGEVESFLAKHWLRLRGLEGHQH